MKLKNLTLVVVLLLLSGCYQNGYHPTYIISEEERVLQDHIR